MALADWGVGVEWETSNEEKGQDFQKFLKQRGPKTKKGEVIIIFCLTG